MSIRDWFTVQASNSASAPDGWPEGMTRDEVNDSGRGMMGYVKEWYDDPGFRQPFDDYTFTRVTNTQFTLADGPIEAPGTAAGASDIMAIGQRIRMVLGGTTWEGTIATLSYSGVPGSGTTTFTVDWTIPSATGPASQPSSILVHDKDLRDSAFSPTGTTLAQSPPQIPTIDDLESHVTKPENTLDVGFLEGHNADALEIHSARNRLNFNGNLDIWQRGTSFTAATTPTNDNDNVCADGFTIISDGNDRVDIARSTDVPTGIGARYSMRLEAVSTQKFGVLVPIEKQDAGDQAESGTTESVSASFYAKLDGAATGIGNLRAYLVNIKAASGIPTNTPITNWNAGSADVDVVVDATDWEIAASARVTLTSSWQRFTPASLLGVDMDVSGAGSGAIALMIHVDDITYAATAAFFLAGVQVNAGSDHMQFIRHPIAWEYARAQRYCMTTFDDGGPIGDGQGDNESLVAVGAAPRVAFDWRFQTPMLKQPTVVTFNPRVGGATGQVTDGTSDIGVPSVTTRSTRGAWLVRNVSAVTGTLYRVAAYAHANIWGNS